MHGKILTPIGFVWVAGVLAPHALQVDSADWAVISEHSIKLIIVVLCKNDKVLVSLLSSIKTIILMLAVESRWSILTHDESIVLVAAKWLRWVKHWAGIY